MGIKKKKKAQFSSIHKTKDTLLYSSFYPGYWPVLARDIRRYFSLVGVPSFAPAVAIAKAEAADRALRLLSNSRHEDTTMPLLNENRENSMVVGREEKNVTLVSYHSIGAHIISQAFQPHYGYSCKLLFISCKCLRKCAHLYLCHVYLLYLFCV